MTMPALPTSLPPGTPSVPTGFSDPQGIITAYAQQNLINVADPQVASAISSIQQAALQEGQAIAGNETLQRVQTLFTQYKSLYSSLSTGGYANAASVALGAARQYVTQNHELSGALSTVQGLVTAFQRASSGASTPQDVAAAFSGPLIAAAVAAGASAGVGAAIVGAVAVAASLLDAAGFGADKPGVQVCSDFKYTGGGTPDYAIGCMAVFDSTGSPINPGSTNWRSFPNPNHPDDAWWFQPVADGNYADWRKARWIPEPISRSVEEMVVAGVAYGSKIGPAMQMPVDYRLTPIAVAFGDDWWWAVANCGNRNYAQAITQPRNPSPLYWAMSKAGTLPAQLSNEQSTALLAFDGAYAKAWESNAEYWLNGHRGTAKPDGTPDGAAVLLHVAEIWNRAHEPGQGVAVGWPGPLARGQELTSVWWAHSVEQLVNAGNPDVLTPDRSKLFLHTGRLKSASGPPPILLLSELGNLHLAPVKLPSHTTTGAKGARPFVAVGATAVTASALVLAARHFLLR